MRVAGWDALVMTTGGARRSDDDVKALAGRRDQLSDDNAVFPSDIKFDKNGKIPAKTCFLGSFLEDLFLVPLDDSFSYSCP